MTTGPVTAGAVPATATARAPLRPSALHRALVRPGALWRDVRVVAQTGSTNTDLLTAARAGAAEGLVLAAEEQTAGRGRMGRHWVSPPRSALTFSVLLRPASVPPARRGWLPLLAGVAVASALRATAAVDARLKWPNDVLLDGAKAAGILAEQSGDAVVLGTGINVSAGRDEMPAAGATSLAMAGAVCTDREHLLVCVLAELERWYLAWLRATGPAGPAGRGPAGRGPAGRGPAGRGPAGSAQAGSGQAGSGQAGSAQAGPGDADACGLRPEYRRLSATLGSPVRVSLPGGQVLTGAAQDVDEAGRLVILTASGLVAVSAGDVVHLR